MCTVLLLLLLSPAPDNLYKFLFLHAIRNLWKCFVKKLSTCAAMLAINVISIKMWGMHVPLNATRTARVMRGWRGLLRGCLRFACNSSFFIEKEITWKRLLLLVHCNAGEIRRRRWRELRKIFISFHCCAIIYVLVVFVDLIKLEKNKLFYLCYCYLIFRKIYNLVTLIRKSDAIFPPDNPTR